MGSNHLDDVVAQIPNFGTWAHSGKIKFFGWYAIRRGDKERFDAADVKSGYDQTHLSPSANLATDLARLVDRAELLTDGRGFRLERSVRVKLDREFGEILSPPRTPLAELAGVSRTPFLTEDEVSDARRMAELYLVVHCFENSVRRLIAVTLEQHFGPDWWPKARSNEMDRKVSDRQGKEKANRWLTARGGSPLFYLDWADLVTLIRKHEAQFQARIGSVKFAALRLEEMESLRNVVAHNGVLSSPDDHTRVLLHFKDWSKQVS